MGSHRARRRGLRGGGLAASRAVPHCDDEGAGPELREGGKTHSQRADASPANPGARNVLPQARKLIRPKCVPWRRSPCALR